MGNLVMIFLSSCKQSTICSKWDTLSWDANPLDAVTRAALYTLYSPCLYSSLRLHFAPLFSQTPQLKSEAWYTLRKSPSRTIIENLNSAIKGSHFQSVEWPSECSELWLRRELHSCNHVNTSTGVQCGILMRLFLLMVLLNNGGKEFVLVRPRGGVLTQNLGRCSVWH